MRPLRERLRLQHAVHTLTEERDRRLKVILVCSVATKISPASRTSASPGYSRTSQTEANRRKTQVCIPNLDHDRTVASLLNNETRGVGLPKWTPTTPKADAASVASCHITLLGFHNHEVIPRRSVRCQDYAEKSRPAQNCHLKPQPSTWQKLLSKLILPGSRNILRTNDLPRGGFPCHPDDAEEMIQQLPSAATASIS